MSQRSLFVYLRMNLSERDAKVIWHPYTQHKNLDLPIPIVKGEGALLFDESGKTYIDAVSSWWVTLHGHAHPYIAQKIYQQALELEQVIFTSFTHTPAVHLAEKLLEILPGKFSKIFYSDNGSTAVEVALKMCFQFWLNHGEKNRTKILAFENAYHGDTFGAMSVSGRGLFTDAFKNQLFDVVFIETPDDSNIEQLKKIIDLHAGELSAFIYEPLLQAAGGMKMYASAPMNELLSHVRKKDILCIADEVLTGFGRTGSLFAGERISQQPDIICLSKGLSGGFMALGATACTEKIFSAFLSDDRTKTFFHGHSFTANPLACAAALASMDLLLGDNTLSAIRTIQSQHEVFVNEKLSLLNQDSFENIRIMGTILAFEIKSGKNEYINQVGKEIMQRALLQGIYLRPLGNTVYVMPPYCIRPEQLRKIYQFISSLAF